MRFEAASTGSIPVDAANFRRTIMCECYQVGGPFVAEDPDCPIHGRQSVGREDRINSILERVRDGEVSPGEGTSLIMEEFY